MTHINFRCLRYCKQVIRIVSTLPPAVNSSLRLQLTDLTFKLRSTAHASKLQSTMHAESNTFHTLLTNRLSALVREMRTTQTLLACALANRTFTQCCREFQAWQLLSRLVLRSINESHSFVRTSVAVVVVVVVISCYHISYIYIYIYTHSPLYR